MVIRPQSDLVYLSRYTLFISNALKSKTGGSLLSSVTVNLTTSIDPADKFPRVSDDSLLTIVQEKTFRYFWEFGHPVSGMARTQLIGRPGDFRRNRIWHHVHPGSVERKFISRAEGLDRMLTITDFLLIRRSGSTAPGRTGSAALPASQSSSAPTITGAIW
jgi:hypothetical protein